jgi:hypothetical protein
VVFAAGPTLTEATPNGHYVQISRWGASGKKEEFKPV